MSRSGSNDICSSLDARRSSDLCVMACSICAIDRPVMDKGRGVVLHGPRCFASLSRLASPSDALDP